MVGYEPTGREFESHQWLAKYRSKWYTVTMKTFRYDVNIVVEVQAFNEIDAEEAVRDAFGLGEVYGLNIIESEVGDFTVAE